MTTTDPWAQYPGMSTQKDKEKKHDSVVPEPALTGLFIVGLAVAIVAARVISFRYPWLAHRVGLKT